MRNLSYLLPAAVIALLAWLGKPSWWAVAMLTGGAMFAWDYLWGDRRVLDAAHGVKLIVAGVAALALAYGFAWGAGMSLADFQATGKGLGRREAFLYHLPSMAIGLALYGLLVWSRAWSREQER